MSNMNVEILLQLSDKFSPAMNKALTASKNFATGFNGAMGKVDNALNSVTGKLAILGVSIGAAATVNKMIKFEDRINKIGTIAKQTAKDTAEYEKATKGLGDEIYRVANMPSVKVDAGDLLASMEEVAKRTGDVIFARENLETIGTAMSAFGASGGEIGGLLAEFQKQGLGAKQISKLMDELYVQGNKGAFTADKFAKYGSQIIAAYLPIGSSAEDIKNANAAIQILMMGIGEEAQSVTALRSLMSDLGNDAKQKQLKKYGIAVRDTDGKMRDLNDIMLDIANVQKNLKGDEIDKFMATFGDVAKQGVQAYIQYGHNADALINLGNVEGEYAKAGKKNAESLAANLRNLQTAFDRFAHKNFAPILKEVTGILDKFAENPERFQTVFKMLAIGIGLVFTIKTISMIAQTVSGFKSMIGLVGKAGNIPNIGGTSAAGATPVFVTNLGQGGMNLPSTNATPDFAKGSVLSKSGISGGQLAAAGITSGLVAATIAIPLAVTDWQTAEKDETLTKKEKGKRKGGAAGGATGTILGAVGGALAGAASSAAIGAAIGSVVPGLGTAIGGAVGGVIGLGGAVLGGKIGKSIGSKLGEDIATDKEARENGQLTMSQESIQKRFGYNFDKMKNVESIPSQKQIAELQGDAKITVDVNMKDDRTEIKTKTNSNIDGTEFQVGSVNEAYSW